MPPKNKFNRNNNNNNQSSQQEIQDPRFKRVHNDPRFLRAKKKDTKVVIDNRFKSMLKSKEFGSGSGPKVDKYGRRIQANNAEKELKRFYHIDQDEDEDSDDEEEKTLSDLEREVMADEGNLEDEISEESDDEDVTIKKPKLKLGQKGYDPMRGKGVIGSSSDEDEDTSDEEEDIEDEEESEEEIEVPRIATGEETRRLALVNMDWDKIKSMDLYQVLNGFKPKTGVIERVSIYPSEFGKQRMEIEEREGPPKDIFKATNGGDEDEKEKEIDDEGSDDEEVTEKTIIRDQLEEGGGEDFDQDALRKYQLDRLKYYYAVVECDSPFTAKIICQTCDGNEYESSANFFDIRYIPDDMTFDDDVPRDTCTHVADNYKPVKFSTEALQHTKVKLTWDQDEPERIELTRRDFTEQDLKDLDFEAYLASSSSEDDDDENDENDDSLEKIRAKYRKLLQETNENVYDDKDMENGNSDNDGDMEITFTPGLSELAATKLNQDDDDDDDNEEEKEETSIEKYMRKQKEKRLAKKERRENKWKEENVSSTTDKNDKKKINNDMLESDTDEELEQDDYFKEARQEMEQELSLDKKKDENKKDKKKKNKKKKLTKEERLEQKRQKAELELLMDDHQGKGDGFDMKEIMKLEKLEKKKGKKTRREKELLETTTDDFEMNVNDPRFAAVQDSHHFAIDPTNPQFKKTKSMKKLMEARQSKLKQHTDQADDWKKENNSKAMKNQQNDEKKSKDASLSQLIDSVKRKGALSQPKIGKRQKV